ncbi:hypothetical protein ACFXK0_15745 [Nocardia sp. NPDC059177]|uniref:hypothetical protein n=1 Tax=Nocardia sp. NPDC059177 TaxID=3346759 RepID=UPI00368994BF
MELNESLLRLLPAGVDLQANDDDLVEPFKSAALSGWIQHSTGAWFIQSFMDSYRGRIDAFSDLTSAEAAINGRAIPDQDLEVSNPCRAEAIARRGIAFGCAAISRLRDYSNAPMAVSYVSVGPALYDERVITGAVTVTTCHPNESPYISDINGFGGTGIIIIRS